MRIEPEALRRYITEILQAERVDDHQAESVADSMLWNDLAGRNSQGTLRLPVLLIRLRRGLIQRDCNPTFTSVSDNSHSLNGDAGFGQHVGRLATLKAIENARAHGVGVVGVLNSNFFGSGAYYTSIAANEGMLCFAASNSFPKVAAHGGKHPVLGTNPLAFGAPRANGQHLLVDMATAALAGSTVRAHQEAGTPLPAGLAVDSNGNPITDPSMVAQGALLPFAGAKGFGLSLMVEVLCGVLTGAGVMSEVGSMFNDFTKSSNNGHFFIVIDVSKWMPLERYYERFEQLVRDIKNSGDAGAVRIPGEIRWAQYQKNQNEGILFPERLRKELEEISRPFNIIAPWAS